MAFPRSLFGKPTVAVFWGWIILGLILWLISVVDGSLYQDMLRAVDYAAAKGAEMVETRQTMAISFIYISLAYFIVVTLLGALLVHKSAAGRKWAFFLLIPAALWWAYESASAPFVLGRMYPGTIEISDWAIAMLGAAVWLFILGYTARARMEAAI